VVFRNRQHAGEVLAGQLRAYAGRADVTVLGLVRGGVPVAVEVARMLDVPMDVLVIRKLGVPWAPEVAFAALGPGGVVVHNTSVESRVAPGDVADVTAQEQSELTRRERLYRAGREQLRLAGRIAIIVDDGLATGATARTAVAVVRRLGAARVVAAVPVGAPDALALLEAEADAVICPYAPVDFGAVSRFYQRFEQVSDDEVVRLMASVGSDRHVDEAGQV
jgi:predicted phosphoribosyltransferase